MKAKWIEHNDPNRIDNKVWIECSDCGFISLIKSYECPHCKYITSKENKKL